MATRTHSISFWTDQNFCFSGSTPCSNRNQWLDSSTQRCWQRRWGGRGWHSSLLGWSGEGTYWHSTAPQIKDDILFHCAQLKIGQCNYFVDAKSQKRSRLKIHSSAENQQDISQLNHCSSCALTWPDQQTHLGKIVANRKRSLPYGSCTGKILEMLPHLRMQQG